jgi:hypothetical protein
MNYFPGLPRHGVVGTENPAVLTSRLLVVIVSGSSIKLRMTITLTFTSTTRFPFSREQQVLQKTPSKFESVF